MWAKASPQGRLHRGKTEGGLPSETAASASQGDRPRVQPRTPRSDSSPGTVRKKGMSPARAPGPWSSVTAARDDDHSAGAVLGQLPKCTSGPNPAALRAGPQPAVGAVSPHHRAHARARSSPLRCFAPPETGPRRGSQGSPGARPASDAPRGLRTGHCGDGRHGSAWGSSSDLHAAPQLEGGPRAAASGEGAPSGWGGGAGRRAGRPPPPAEPPGEQRRLERRTPAECTMHLGAPVVPDENMMKSGWPKGSCSNSSCGACSPLPVARKSSRNTLGAKHTDANGERSRTLGCIPRPPRLDLAARCPLLLPGRISWEN